MPLLNLTKEQIEEKIKYIDHYIHSQNSASGSLVDANANVDTKNIGILEAEMYKPDTIQVNRALVQRKLTEKYGKKIAEKYIEDIEKHRIYIHDETSLRPYCASITLFPFLLNGTKPLGGTSEAPKNIHSFCGSFVNLVYQVASGFAGAIATVEFLLYFDYFAKKTWGADYLDLHTAEVRQALQGVVYALNQPASARGNQSVFWNISVLDRFYFEQLFGGFKFPDGTQPVYEGSFRKLQMFFMEWFRKERERALLTYPVLTASLLVDAEGKPKDKHFAWTCAEEMSKGLSFFVYESDSVDSLSSCCRLRNEFTDNTFSYTLGAGGVSTGSVQVITINMNRYVQTREEPFSTLIDRVHMYLLAHRAVIEDYIEGGLLPAYSTGFISLDKQFCTIGINGMLEASEYVKGKADTDFFSSYLKEIYESNKEWKEDTGVKFNTEHVPAENLGVKNAKWDKEAGLKVPRDCYNSYFYKVEDESCNLIDKFILHGKRLTKYLDGGSALHANLEEHLSKPQYKKVMEIAINTGCSYFTFNIPNTVCNDCGFITKHNLPKCPKCGSDNVDYLTRIIGYLKRVSKWSEARQKEAKTRYYDNNVNV